VLYEVWGKTVILGVIDIADPTVVTADQVATRIRAALRHVQPRKLVLAPDCGMKYLARDVAYGKLCALAAGANAVRAEVA
jgi:5-methyltetrahydropteroyltriglutamate--homocysteine methyltransferase